MCTLYNIQCLVVVENYCGLVLLTLLCCSGYLPSCVEEWQKLLHLRELQEYSSHHTPPAHHSRHSTESTVGSQPDANQDRDIPPPSVHIDNERHVYCLKCGVDFIATVQKMPRTNHTECQPPDDLEDDPSTLLKDIGDKTLLQMSKASHTLSNSTDCTLSKCLLNAEDSTTVAGGECASPLRAVEWEELAYLLVSQVGVRSALATLEGVRMPPHALSAAFFDSCLRVEAIQQQQRWASHISTQVVCTVIRK